MIPRSLITIAFAALTANAAAANPSIILQSTTSTKNSGLYEHLLPLFSETSETTVHVVAVGTGQAIRNAANCDGDVLIVHARAAEETFVAEGRGVARTDLMYNDFVIVGPKADPAGLKGTQDATKALEVIASSGAIFASRGDDSGTHRKEQALWAATDTDPSGASGTWYRETGSGMGATLNVAVGMGAYTLTDRATWIGFQNKQDFEVHVEGDADLFNQYGVILVNPTQCPSVNAEAGQAFIDWLLSKAGQDAIAGDSLNDQQLFFPNAPAQ